MSPTPASLRGVVIAAFALRRPAADRFSTRPCGAARWAECPRSRVDELPEETSGCTPGSFASACSLLDVVGRAYSGRPWPRCHSCRAPRAHGMGWTDLTHVAEVPDGQQWKLNTVSIRGLGARIRGSCAASRPTTRRPDRSRGGKRASKAAPSRMCWTSAPLWSVATPPPWPTRASR